MRCPVSKNQGHHLHSSHLCFSQETQPPPNNTLYPLLPQPQSLQPRVLLTELFGTRDMKDQTRYILGHQEKC